MCFSAPASFMAATIAGAAGMAALARVHERREVPLAAMPVFFAIQQAIEGFLWLSLPTSPDQAVTTGLSQAFLLFALVFWPVFAPMAILGAETDPRRRRWMSLGLMFGLGVAVYFLIALHLAPRSAVIDAGHIVYSGDPYLPVTVQVLYPIATCLTPMLSSFWPVRALGVIVFAGSIAAYLAYWQAFSSVWCFFAALASAVIVFQFEQEKRKRATSAPSG
jgi:hypothetical protein